MNSDTPTISLDDVDIHVLSEEETARQILTQLALGRGGYVVTVNLDHMLRCRRDPSYLRLVRKADLVVADGMPLVWASRLQGTPLPERVAGSSLSLSLAAALAETGRSLFLLGGNPGVAEEAQLTLQDRFPGLRVVGTHCPPLGFEREEHELNAIRDKLNQTQPDVVYVALGSPKQERTIELLQECLPQAWWLGVGISLSFITGEVQRAPVWIQRLGLEWAHRLVQEPRRLFRRYIIDGLPYAAQLLSGSLWKRWRPVR